MNSNLFNQIVMVWIFSSVLAWPFTGIFVFGGDFVPKALRFLRVLGFGLALVSVLSFALVGPLILQKALNADMTSGIIAGAVVSLFIWVVFHMGGANFILLNSAYRLLRWKTIL